MVILPIKNSSKTHAVNPGKIIALGLNYRAHIEESVSVKAKGFTHETPSEPVLFNKTPNVLIASGEPIIIPAFIKNYHFKQPRTDYEAELAIIIRQRCKNITPSQAGGMIAGYTCMNDVSQRNLQTGDKSGWFRGKSLDTFGPIGPVLVPPEEIGNPQNLRIECRLNGQTVQSANTRQMIFSIPEIIAFVSQNFTLIPGDLIMTGTPAGVGPLQAGDIVEVEIENIGILRNPVKSE